MILEEKARGAVTVLSFAGEYDTLDVPKFTAAVVGLVGRGRTRLVLDLAKMTFINSTGLGSLIREQERLAQAGGEIACAALTKFTDRNFRLLGLDKRIPCFATVDEAVAHVEAAGRKGAAGTGGRRVAFRFPDEGTAGLEKRAEILEIREEGMTFRLDDLEGMDPAAVFAAGRALDLRFGLEPVDPARELRAKGKVESAETAAARRVSVRVAFAGLADADRQAIGRLVRDLRYVGGGSADAGERNS